MQQVAVKERTTSGKIQRRQTRALLHSGGLEVVLELSHDPVTDKGNAQQPAEHTLVAVPVSTSEMKQRGASLSSGAGPRMRQSSRSRDAAIGRPQSELLDFFEEPPSRQEDGGGVGAATTPEV